MQAALAGPAKTPSDAAPGNIRPKTGVGTSSPGNLANIAAIRFSSSPRSGIGSLWFETSAARRLPFGRLLKYFTDSSRGNLAHGAGH